ncbi:metalloprotease family protein [Geobacter sp. SVR]|uniref:metalloprotease family protein n=1 Tax=Geobacter sp. SVR TaxID=2495594 RepID=UPI00156390C0|nr:metalloprotease family protein [Geobacter sp. SVR]
MLRLLLSYATFPGVIAHEFSHAWVCRRLGIPVERVCYLRLGNPMGYVLHARPSSAILHIMVAMAPFYVSTFLAAALALAASLIGRYLSFSGQDAAILLTVWCSFSLALHAFPSEGDAHSLWNDVRNPEVGWLSKGLLVPAVALIRLVRLGARCWLDVLFALGVVALPPAALLVLTG